MCLINIMMEYLKEHPDNGKLFSTRAMLLKLQRRLLTLGIVRDPNHISCKIRNLKFAYKKVQSNPSEGTHGAYGEGLIPELKNVFGTLSDDECLPNATNYSYSAAGLLGEVLVKEENQLDLDEEEMEDQESNDDKYDLLELNHADEEDESNAAEQEEESTPIEALSTNPPAKKKRKPSAAAEIINATKLMIDAQRTMFHQQMKQDREEAEKDRRLLQSIFQSFNKK
ncbi:hypothetical protein DMENIID0001_139310 [Sergentomyia squamirostris]